MIEPKDLDSSYTFQIDGDLIADKEKGEITFSYYLVDTKGNKSQTYKKTISGFKKEENPLPIDPNDENSRITKFAIELEAYLDVNNENIVPIFWSLVYKKEWQYNDYAHLAVLECYAHFLFQNLIQE